MSFNLHNFIKFANASAEEAKFQVMNSIRSQATQDNLNSRNGSLDSNSFDANMTSEDRSSGKYDTLTNNNQSFFSDILKDYSKVDNIKNELGKKTQIAESQGNMSLAKNLRNAKDHLSDPSIHTDFNKWFSSLSKK